MKTVKATHPHPTNENLSGGAEGVFYTYWFEKNLQGDIIAVYNEGGTKIISYTYDAWGNMTSTTSNYTGNNRYASLNPFRYRGYYYDTDTGYYYLQSRYYNPSWGRFLNADGIAYLGAGDEFLGFNLFAYCGNNPVMGYDPEGTWNWGKFRKAVTSGIAFVSTLLITADINKANQAASLAVELIDLHYSRLNLEGDFPDAINPDTYRNDYEGQYNFDVKAQCHQFSAEKFNDNIKIVSLDGHYEAIYDKSGNKVRRLVSNEIYSAKQCDGICKLPEPILFKFRGVPKDYYETVEWKSLWCFGRIWAWRVGFG
ncbi:MAG: hypothetical protein J5885_02285 [Clostridia bacterium]|nr:hypothetical protein [Clostridia bacterium]